MIFIVRHELSAELWRDFRLIAMTWRGSRRLVGHELGRWCIGLILASFLLKSLVPVGFMPTFSPGSDGSLKIVICTATGAKLVSTMDGDEPPTNQSHSDQPCVFSGLAQVALLEPDVIAIVPRSYSEPTIWLLIAFSLPPVRARPQLGSRGPPSLV